MWVRALVGYQKAFGYEYQNTVLVRRILATLKQFTLFLQGFSARHIKVKNANQKLINVFQGKAILQKHLKKNFWKKKTWSWSPDQRIRLIWNKLCIPTFENTGAAALLNCFLFMSFPKAEAGYTRQGDWQNPIFFVCSCEVDRTVDGW